ncbi:MAG: MATE family efflux transporter [Prevotella sp.]
MKRKDNYTFLTGAPEHKVIFVMAVPAIISMLVTSLYNIVTTFYVGQIDTQATAAVGIVFPVMSVIQAVGMTFGQGSGNYMSRELGAKRHDNARRMATTSLLLAVITGFIIAAGGLSFLHDLSVLLGSTSTILPYTESYLSYVLMAAPFMTGALCLNSQMRFQGNASFAMFGIIAGALVNVFLAPILIFVFGMGITGAGISTFAGEVCSLLLLLFLDSKGGGFSLCLSDFAPSTSLFKEILAGGTPSLTRQGMASVGVTLLNVAAGAFGDAAIAAMSIVSRIVFVLFASLIGLGQGFQPMCGYCFGAGLYSRVRRGYWFIVRTGVLFMLVVLLFGYLFSGECISVFRDDPAVIEIGTVALRWQLLTLPLGAVVMYTNMMMQTIRKPWQANILSSARNGLFFIPLIMILPPVFGLLGVQMCQAWADVLSFLLAVPIAASGLKSLDK